MKKALLVSLVLLTQTLAAKAQANEQAQAVPVSPAKGDRAVYRVTSGKERTLLHELVQEITDHYPERAHFQLRATRLVPGAQPEVELEEQPEEAFVTSEVIEGILKNCRALEGKPEKLKVAGKTLDTCKLTFSEEGYLRYTWFASVPFGIARDHEEQDSDDLSEGVMGKVIETTELTEYQFGRP